MMSEKRFEFYSDEDLIGVLDTVTGRTFNSFEIVDCLNEQQDTINKLRKILAEAEDTIETRLPEHYLKEYENIKHNIIGDNDE